MLAIYKNTGLFVLISKMVIVNKIIDVKVHRLAIKPMIVSYSLAKEASSCMR